MTAAFARMQRVTRTTVVATMLLGQLRIRKVARVDVLVR